MEEHQENGMIRLGLTNQFETLEMIRHLLTFALIFLALFAYLSVLYVSSYDIADGLKVKRICLKILSKVVWVNFSTDKVN